MTTIFSRREVPARAGLFALATAFFLVVAQTSVALADNAKVAIDNFSFTPAVLMIKPGTTVVFENHDDIPHTVIDAAGSFHSKALDTNDKFSFTFKKPGEIVYFCGLHPYMKGKIIVAP